MVEEKRKLSKATVILIMEAGTFSSMSYTKNSIRKMKLPKQLPLTVCFDDKRVVGKVKNIRCESSKIFGDFFYKPEYELFYVGPRLLMDVTTIRKKRFGRGIKLVGISIINFPYKFHCSTKLVNDIDFDKEMEDEKKCRKKSTS